jgi:hypothetical protein
VLDDVKFKDGIRVTDDDTNDTTVEKVPPERSQAMPSTTLDNCSPICPGEVTPDVVSGRPFPGRHALHYGAAHTLAGRPEPHRVMVPRGICVDRTDVQ